MLNKRAILFVNGELRSKEVVLSVLKPDDFLVAVDGGLRHLEHLSLRPSLLVGDLDSISLQQLENLSQDGIEVARFPEKKDETDLELAIEIVLRKGFQSMLVVGALGGRLDQTLGNIFLLSQPALRDCNIWMDDGVEEVFLIHTTQQINGSPGDRVSLLPLVGTVSGISTTGLEYPLRNATLFLHQTRGISNVMLNDAARIQIKDGLLLCIHTRKQSADKLYEE